MSAESVTQTSTPSFSPTEKPGDSSEEQPTEVPSIQPTEQPSSSTQQPENNVDTGDSSISLTTVIVFFVLSAVLFAITTLKRKNY